MKKLQNDYTTPEQSKRLLELGVPANSANNYYGKNGKIRYIDGSIPCSLLWAVGLVPCWSVGRLIEIIRECSTDYDTCKILVETLVIPTTDNVDALVELICFAKCDLDFSKLED